MSFHIVMYPWFAIGHITSFLHLANKLAKRGNKISFILPNKAHKKVASLNKYPQLIHFIPIVVPHVDGLPLGVETTNDVPSLKGLRLLREAMNLTRDTIETHLASLKHDFVIFDLPLWLPDLARKYGSKSIFYSTLNLMIYGYSSLQARNLPNDHQITEADLIGPPPGFPCPAIRLHSHEARVMAYTVTNIGKNLNVAMQESDAIATNSCKEIDGPFSDFVEKLIGKPVLLAGPVLPESATSATLDEYFDHWLNGFSHRSVVYCALGSEVALTIEQFHELVLGLELSGRPFLAALKPPQGFKTIESALPEGFEERTKGKGIVHEGWVQQQLILQHPSVGCFVTHCGVGSLSEAMVSECQLVLLPQQADQFFNARLTSIEFKVGVEVERRDDDGYFTKEAVDKVISTVMDSESEVGKEVRTNHAKRRELLLKEGLEDNYINSFIQSLQELRCG